MNRTVLVLVALILLAATFAFATDTNLVDPAYCTAAGHSAAAPVEGCG